MTAFAVIRNESRSTRWATTRPWGAHNDVNLLLLCVALSYTLTAFFAGRGRLDDGRGAEGGPLCEFRAIYRGDSLRPEFAIA